MQEAEIDVLLQNIRRAFGRARPSVPPHNLQKEYGRKSYTSMLSLIKRQLGLAELSLCLGTVRSGGPPKAPAWVHLPREMPVFGTPEFKTKTLTVFIRRAFLDRASFEQVVCTMAHELSHVVLETIRHPDKDNEKAVDLTAMFMGYREFFLSGYSTEFSFEPPSLPTLDFSFENLGRLLELMTYEPKVEMIQRHVGYLSLEEREYAATVLARESAMT